MKIITKVSASLILLAASSGAFANISKTIIGQDDKDQIPGRYIVVLKEPRSLDISSHETVRSFVHGQAERMARGAAGQIEKQYHHNLRAFTLKTDLAGAKRLASDPNVAFIEADRTIYLFNDQESAPWGLDRIDSRSGLNGSYSYASSGTGVNAYIIDTGIRSTHEQFEGRVAEGFTSITDGNGSEDCMGHGTHVAGTVGGKDYGVAKNVTLYPVRVFGCSGSTTTTAILDGIEWVAKNAVKPAVANMSLGGGRSEVLDNAVENLVKAGVIAVVAAGNSNRNACEFSPAAVPSAITVGSTTSRDRRSSFSNFGRCVDIFAPGSDIRSAWWNSDSATSTISGTSMAAPHVAGAVALILETMPDTNASDMEMILKQSATPQIIEDKGVSSPNLMLFSRIDQIEGPLPDPKNTCPECTKTGGEVISGTKVIIPESGSFKSDGHVRIKWDMELQSNVSITLQKRNWLFHWNNVASSDSVQDSKDISYKGDEGVYRIIVKADEQGADSAFELVLNY